MRARDWFAVGIRLIGFWFLVKPISWFASMIDVVVNEIERRPGATPVGGLLIYIAADVLVGLVLVRFAEGIANICYGHPRSSDDLLRDIRRFDDDEDDGIKQREKSTH